MTEDLNKIRCRALKLIEAKLRADDRPRFHMFIIISATGSAAFLFSFLLLEIGVSAMWIRYPLTVGLAYVIFLILLRLWLACWASGKYIVICDRRFDQVDGVALVADSVVDTLDGGGSVHETTSNVAGVLDMDEVIFVIIAAAALCAGLLVCVYLIWTAPVLLAELLVDGFVMSKVYKKLKRIDQPRWICGALRRTWFPAVLVALFFAIAGFCMQRIAPGAESIGAVVAYWVDNR